MRTIKWLDGARRRGWPRHKHPIPGSATDVKPTMIREISSNSCNSLGFVSAILSGQINEWDMSLYLENQKPKIALNNLPNFIARKYFHSSLLFASELWTAKFSGRMTMQGWGEAWPTSRRYWIEVFEVWIVIRFHAIVNMASKSKKSLKRKFLEHSDSEDDEKSELQMILGACSTLNKFYVSHQMLGVFFYRVPNSNLKNVRTSKHCVCT